MHCVCVCVCVCVTTQPGLPRPPAISALYSPQLSSRVWAGVRNEDLMSCTIRRPWRRVQEAPSPRHVGYVVCLDICPFIRHPLALHFYFWQLYWLFLLYFNKSVVLHNLVCGTPIHVTCREPCMWQTHCQTHTAFGLQLWTPAGAEDDLWPDLWPEDDLCACLRVYADVHKMTVDLGMRIHTHTHKCTLTGQWHVGCSDWVKAVFFFVFF